MRWQSICSGKIENINEIMNWFTENLIARTILFLSTFRALFVSGVVPI